MDRCNDIRRQELRTTIQGKISIILYVSMKELWGKENYTDFAM